MAVMSLLAVAAICLAALPSVMGHAALTSPVAYNANPSKSFTCGGVGAGPLNYLPGDGAKTFSWRLIAGDGSGPVRMLVDTEGKTTGFPNSYTGAVTGTVVAVPVSGTTPTAVGTTYDFTYTLPAGLTCTGTMGGSTQVCTVQITSETNWVACFAFTKEAGPTTTTSTGTAPRQYYGNCATAQASQLTACPMIVAQRVWVPTGSDISDMDASVTATLNQNMDNVNVFYNHQPATTASPCRDAYTSFLCAQTFVPCNAAGTAPLTTTFQDQPCQSTCQEFTCWCDLNPLHADLYRCAYQNANKDVTGRCGRKFGPNNATCVPVIRSSTGPNCVNGLCSDAPVTASHSPMILFGAAVLAVAALAIRQ